MNAQRRKQIVALADKLSDLRTVNLPLSTADVIALAEKHAGPNASAQLCIVDAQRLWNMQLFASAAKRACDSLRYSVGVFHPDYKLADEHRRTAYGA